MTREEKALIYFKDLRKRKVKDYSSVFDAAPKDSVVYEAVSAEIEIYDTTIKALDREPKWIPVSKPPKKDGEYLVTIHGITHDYISVVGYSKNLFTVDEYDFYDKKRAGWYEYVAESGYYEVTKVVAWMPSPEPYKAERSE